MDKEKIIKPSGTLRKTFRDLADKFLYQFRKGLLTEVGKWSIIVEGKNFECQLMILN